MQRREVDRALSGDPQTVGTTLSSLPEDQWFERKSVRTSPQKLSQALVAFANAEGGTLVIGLHDGTVEGTDADPKGRNELMQAHVQHVHPPVRTRSRLVPCRKDDGSPDHLLVIDVAAGEEVHATTKDDFYLRVGDESRRLTFVQRQELLFDKRQSGFEAQLTGEGVSAADQDLAEDYAATVGHPSWERLFDARGLSGEGRLTVAGLLLFGRDPQRTMPNAHLRVSRFAGRDRGTGARQHLQSDERFEGPIPLALRAAVDHVTRVQPRRRALGREGRFEDIPIVPADAWLEGVVNAVVHRSYSLQGDHIHIDVFDDRIEIESPGRFPGLVDLQNVIAASRFARNPRVARVCADLHFGQEFGEGIKRMFEEMRLAGLQDPFYRQTANSVRLTLSAEATDRELDARLPEETRTIVMALREASRLSTSELAEVMGRTRPTAIRRLQALEALGVVEWVGTSPKDPRAYWHLPG